MIGSFGKIVFEVSFDDEKILVRSFSDFKRQTTFRWSSHDIIARKPKLEFGGVDASSIGFSMIFSKALGVKPLEEVRQLQEMANKGDVGQLVLGGEAFGKYAIESLGEAFSTFGHKGEILQIQCDIAIKEYVENDP